VGRERRPTIAAGIYADIFRAHATGLAGQAGVTVTKNGGTIHPKDFYFAAADATKDTIDASSQMTGVNGTALIIGQNGAGYAGMGGLATDCVWAGGFAASVAGIVFVQVTRPIGAPGKTCAQ